MRDSYADSDIGLSGREIPWGQKAGIVFLVVARADQTAGEELWQEQSLAARMPSHGPCSCWWESSSMSSPRRARIQLQNHCQCHPAQPGSVGETMGALKGAKRGEDLPHASRRKGTWAKGHGESQLRSRCLVYFLVTIILEGHRPMHRRAQPGVCSLFTTLWEFQC